MNPKNNRKKNLNSSRGVALVITLLILLLFTAMTLAMVIATSSDTLINGYYRNYRGAFYAADSGANAARAYLTSLIQSNVTTPYVAFTPPIPVGTDASIRSQLINASTGFGANQSILGSQTASWPASFTLDPTVVNGVSYGNTTLTQQCMGAEYTTTFATTGITGITPPTCTSPGNPATAYTITGYTYYYNYSIGVIGQATSGQQNKVVETGYFNFYVPVTSKAGTTTSFSGWGTLYDKFGLCSAPWVPGTMTGAIFSNDSLNFGDPGQTGTSTKYVFTGTVGIHDADAGYFHTTSRGGSDCQQSSASSNAADGTTIAPTFTGGWSTGQPSIPLPQDSYNQERSVLNGNGACMVSPCPAVAQTEMGVLQDVNHNQWPTSGAQPSSGVYLPYSTTTTGGVTTNTFTGGGIYVQGNAAQVTLTASTSGSGANKHNLQVIAVKQASTTTTVTIDLTGNTTTVTNGTTTTTIQGVPENLGANPPTEACMLYVNGNISSNTGSSTPTGLSGPSSGAAIQNGSALTVTATGEIDITGSITYSTEPVSLNAADTLVSPVPTNVFGIFTPGGNVDLKPTASGQNLEIDASIATISNGGSGGIQASWNSINQVIIVGGRVQNNALDGSSIQNGRNIWFDQRFAGGGFAPPWFPATTIGSTVTYSATPNPPIPVRLSWVNTTSQ
jgi:Tfp pilus assembly protein PilX